MLKVRNITKSFGNTEVLKGVNLEIGKGEILVVVGDTGDIEINGKKLCDNGRYVDKSTLREIRKDIGLVFQNFNLFPHMSVLENLIEAPQRVLGMSKKEAIEKAEETLGFLGLDQKKDNYPYELSGGQKQRVAIGRALVLEPKIICFDEPTSALDPGLTGEVANLIKSLSEKGMSMMIITHDMDFAKNVSDRIVSMNSGKLENGLIFEG